VSNTEFIGQMAQFSALEQMLAVSTNTKSAYIEQSVAEAASLMGKGVYGKDASTGEMTAGTVTNVTVKDGVPILGLSNGGYMSLYDVTYFQEPQQASSQETQQESGA
jgi:hypothetical protein